MFVYWIKQMLCLALNILTHLICSLNIWLENSRDYKSNSVTSVMEFEGASVCRFKSQSHYIALLVSEIAG